MADAKINVIQLHMNYVLRYLSDEIPSKRGVYSATRLKLCGVLDSSKRIVELLEHYLYPSDTHNSHGQGQCVEDESCASDVSWNSQSDAMSPFKPKTPVSVTVEILTSDNKIVKAIYDARVSIWLSAEEWYKPEQVVGWRCLPDV